MELDCVIVSSLDELADRCSAGTGCNDKNAGLEVPVPFGVYQLVLPDDKTRLAVTCLVNTCELGLIFEAPEANDENYVIKLFSTLEKGIKYHLLAPLIPTARIIEAAERVCKMRENKFAVKILQRSNVYKPKKILMSHKVNLCGLNYSQASAVTHFVHMQSGVMTIHGPPGTFICILYHVIIGASTCTMLTYW